MQFPRYDISRFMFDRKFFVCSYTALKEITTYAKWSLIICVQSTFALRTPRYNGHPIIRTVAKSLAKINYRRLTETNSRYYGLSLVRTLTRGPLQCPQ